MTVGLHSLTIVASEFNELLIIISETRDIVLGFLRDSRERFSDIFNQVIASDPEAAKFVQTL